MRTLESLYLDPLMSILQAQNQKLRQINSSAPFIGVFDDQPQESLVLLLDFKTNPEQALPAVLDRLRRFEDAKYLTRWNGSNLVQGPITIVASGFMSWRPDLQNQTHGIVFLDAPLDDLADERATYDISNSFYASAPLRPLVGRIGLWGMSRAQYNKVVGLVKHAHERGLKPRFWGTPSWPMMRRDEVWKQLVRAGVGMLNVDDIRSASLWNWNWCNTPGSRFC
ncbi:hypothetical protein, variant [Verruconis gallopava]|nr:hypothetical protein, variant [Verruconis gallopava]KIW05247.1 hypothetical protein, variant [Verruconis gallopava]